MIDEEGRAKHRNHIGRHFKGLSKNLIIIINQLRTIRSVFLVQIWKNYSKKAWFKNSVKKICYISCTVQCLLTLRRPLRRKMRMRWFFDISKMKESSFLNKTSLTSHQIFDAHLLETTDLSTSRLHFSVGFRSRSCFESDGFIDYSNE